MNNEQKKHEPGYYGLPFEFKVTDIAGNVHYIDTEEEIIGSSYWIRDKIQQFTGILDRNGEKIYFGDTIRFADKLLWYRDEYWSKVALGLMTKDEAIAEIEKMPYEERVIEDSTAFEWLLSDEVQKYWELVKQ